MTCFFFNKNLQQKLTKKDILTEIKMKKTKIEKHSDCKFFDRIYPDAEGFNIFLEISKIQNYITESNKEKLEKAKEVEIKKLKNKLKKLEAQIKESKMKKIKNSTTNQITNNFGKITIKN